MRAAALALLLAGAQAWAEPAPRPPGWPSDICLAEGVNAINPLCGTCSTSVWYPMENLGTLVQWTCKGADGKWMTHGLIRPWMTPPFRPSMADILLKGPWGAYWDANTVRISEPDKLKYAELQERARPWLATAVRPPEPPAVPTAPAPAWIVAAVSTGQRPSYLLAGATPVRETGKFVPTLTAGQPTACTCDGDGNSAMLGAAKLCAAQGYKTAAGAARLVACVVKP